MIKEFDKIADFYDLWVNTTTFTDADTKFYLNMIHKFQPKEVLELGVGDARVSIEIAKTNINVIGIDISEKMIQHGITKAKVNGVSDKITFLIDDISTYTLKSKSEFVIMPFRVFLHLRSLEEKEKALKNIWDNMCEGGILIFDVFQPRIENLKKINGMKILRGQEKLSSSNIKYLWQTVRIQPKTQLMDFLVTLEECENNLVTKVTHQPISFSWIEFSQLKNMFNNVGFEILDVYGNFDLSDFTEQSPHCIPVLKKPLQNKI